MSTSWRADSHWTAMSWATWQLVSPTWRPELEAEHLRRVARALRWCLWKCPVATVSRRRRLGGAAPSDETGAFALEEGAPRRDRSWVLHRHGWRSVQCPRAHHRFGRRDDRRGGHVEACEGWSDSSTARSCRPVVRPRRRTQAGPDPHLGLARHIRVLPHGNHGVAFSKGEQRVGGPNQSDDAE